MPMPASRPRVVARCVAAPAETPKVNPIEEVVLTAGGIAAALTIAAVVALSAVMWLTPTDGLTPGATAFVIDREGGR